MLGAVQCTVFAALTAVIRDHPMNISGLVPHRATVGLAVATVARAAGDTTRPCAGANASRRIVAATRIEEGWKVPQEGRGVKHGLFLKKHKNKLARAS